MCRATRPAKRGVCKDSGGTSAGWATTSMICSMPIALIEIRNGTFTSSMSRKSKYRCWAGSLPNCETRAISSPIPRGIDSPSSISATTLRRHRTRASSLPRPSIWLATAYWNRSPLGNISMFEGSAWPAETSPKMRARPSSWPRAQPSIRHDGSRSHRRSRATASCESPTDTSSSLSAGLALSASSAFATAGKGRSRAMLQAGSIESGSKCLSLTVDQTSSNDTRFAAAPSERGAEGVLAHPTTPMATRAPGPGQTASERAVTHARFMARPSAAVQRSGPRFDRTSRRRPLSMSAAILKAKAA